jgi:hypothetical protein
MDLIKIAARVAAGPELTTIVFDMPGDQDWDPGLWERLGVGQEWERLGRALYNAGAAVDDSEGIAVECEKKDEAEVRKIIEQARAGAYGADAQAYWSAAVEASPDRQPGPA